MLREQSNNFLYRRIGFDRDDVGRHDVNRLHLPSPLDDGSSAALSVLLKEICF